MFLEREFSLPVDSDTLRGRLMFWASANRFVCVSDRQLAMIFQRSGDVSSVVSSDLSSATVEVQVRWDESTKTAYCSVRADPAMGVGASPDARAGQTLIESLVSAMRGVLESNTSTTPPASAPPYVARNQSLQGPPINRPAISNGSGAGKIVAIILAALIGGTVLVAFAWSLAGPALRALHIETPVALSVRQGFLTAHVVSIQNTSHVPLANVSVTAYRPSTGQTAFYSVGSLGPQAVIELGGLEWAWAPQSGDEISVDASGHLSTSFTIHHLP